MKTRAAIKPWWYRLAQQPRHAVPVFEMTTGRRLVPNLPWLVELSPEEMKMMLAWLEKAVR